MLPLAALDQATLALWFSPTPITSRESVALCERSLELACEDDLNMYSAYYRSLPADDARVSAAIASSIWHEKRHFLDLVLTNYGAFRWRQFFLVSANTFPLLHEIKGRLAFPLTIYGDPVRRTAAKVEVPAVQVEQLINEIALRQTILSLESRTYGPKQAQIQAGGDAQLEALAFIFQLGANQCWLGIDGARCFVEDQNETLQSLNYRWAERLADGVGVLPSIDRESYTVVDMTLLVCVLYASLMMRSWNQGYVHPVVGEVGVLTPYPRLRMLLESLAGTEAMVAKWSVADAWELVNGHCKKLFGKTAIGELKDDFDREEAWVGKFPVGSMEAAIALEFHEVRGRLVSALERSPERVLDISRWSNETLPKLQPIVVVANPSGVDGQPPPNMKAVCQSASGERRPWWWAAAAQPRSSQFGFADMKAWLFLLEYLAPFAKLCLAGRRHELMLGPELLTIENELRTMGYDIYFEPNFEFPNESDDTADYYRLTLKNDFKCDFCRAKIERGTGRLIGPWSLRLARGLALACIQGLGGEPNGVRAFQKDWSHWHACEDCLESFRQEQVYPTDEYGVFDGGEVQSSDR